MCSKIESYRAGSALAMLPLLPMLLLAGSTIAVARPALAEDGASQTAPHSQARFGVLDPGENAVRQAGDADRARNTEERLPGFPPERPDRRFAGPRPGGPAQRLGAATVSWTDRFAERRVPAGAAARKANRRPAVCLRGAEVMPPESMAACLSDLHLWQEETAAKAAYAWRGARDAQACWPNASGGSAMTELTRRAVVGGLGGLVGLAAGKAHAASDWPSRTITIVHGFPAGGPSERRRPPHGRRTAKGARAAGHRRTAAGRLRYQRGGLRRPRRARRLHAHGRFRRVTPARRRRSPTCPTARSTISP